MKLVVRITFVVATAAFLVLLGLRAQRPPGRPGGLPMGPSIEGTWAALSFDLKLDAATLAKARPHFQTAWDRRAELMRSSAGDFARMAEGMTGILGDLDAKLKSILPANQVQRLAASEQQRRPPFRGAPAGPGRGRFPSGASRAGTAEYPPTAQTPAEKRVLQVIEDMEKTGAGVASVSPADGRLLRLLVEATGAKSVVEIGTSTGYSGLWIGLGLQQTGGKLTTFEINPRHASLARGHFKRAGVDGIVTIVEGDAHRTLSTVKTPIDLAFIDADKEGYLDYLNQVLPLLQPGGLILAHNMSFPGGSPEYIRAVTTRPDLETIFLNMDGPGVSVTLKKRSPQTRSATAVLRLAFAGTTPTDIL